MCDGSLVDGPYLPQTAARDEGRLSGAKWTLKQRQVWRPLAKLAVLAFQCLQLVGNLGRNPGAPAAVDLGLLQPRMSRLGRAADLIRNGNHRRPLRRMVPLVIQHHPYRSLADIGGKLVRCLADTGSTFSEIGASGKPGAVHSAARTIFSPVLTRMASAQRQSTRSSRPRSAQLHRPGGLAARRAHPHRGRAPGQPHRRTRAVELEHFKVSWPSEPDAWLEEAPAQP